MTIPGRIQNGVVILEGSCTLPEGTAVSVVSQASPIIRISKSRRLAKFPLVPSSHPGTLHLTGKMIANILDEEDLAS